MVGAPRRGPIGDQAAALLAAPAVSALPTGGRSRRNGVRFVGFAEVRATGRLADQ